MPLSRDTLMKTYFEKKNNCKINKSGNVNRGRLLPIQGEGQEGQGRVTSWAELAFDSDNKSYPSTLNTEIKEKSIQESNRWGSKYELYN